MSTRGIPDRLRFGCPFSSVGVGESVYLPGGTKILTVLESSFC